MNSSNKLHPALDTGSPKSEKKEIPTNSLLTQESCKSSSYFKEAELPEYVNDVKIKVIRSSFYLCSSPYLCNWIRGWKPYFSILHIQVKICSFYYLSKIKFSKKSNDVFHSNYIWICMNDLYLFQGLKRERLNILRTKIEEEPSLQPVTEYAGNSG